jgi:hypothetical protein
MTVTTEHERTDDAQREEPRPEDDPEGASCEGGLMRIGTPSESDETD